MEWIAAMQQAITYMEEHLMEEINYEDVARHVHTSSYEFHRAFKRATLVSVSSFCFSIIMIVLSPLVGWIFSLL